MLLTLTHSGVYVHRSDRGIVVLIGPLYGSILPLVALVDVEVFGAYVEVLLLTLGEIQAVCVDLLFILAGRDRALGFSWGIGVGWVLWNAQEVERLGVDQDRGTPIAHLSVVADTHDGVLVVVSDDGQAVDGVLVAVLGQAALLDRLRSILTLSCSTAIHRLLLGSNVPFEQVARHGRADDDVGVVRVEHGLRDLVLAVERQLRPALETDAEDVDQAVGLVHVPLPALAVGREQNLRLRRRPINGRNSSVQLLIALEDKLLVQLAAPLQSIIVLVLVLLSEELIHQVELLTERPFDQTGRVVEEALKVRSLDHLLRLVLVHLGHLHLFQVLFLLALRAQLCFALEVLGVHASSVGCATASATVESLLLLRALHTFEPLVEVVLPAVILVVF